MNKTTCEPNVKKKPILLTKLFFLSSFTKKKKKQLLYQTVSIAYSIILRGYDIVYHSLLCSRRRNHRPPLTKSLGKRGENYLSKKRADLTSNSGKMATLKTKQCLNLVTRFINSRTPPFHYKNTRTLQTLAFEEIQSSPNKPDAPTAFILHGLLGSGRN